MPNGPKMLFPLIVGLAAWFVPGAGYFLLNERKRAVIIFITVTLAFCTGLYIGSIGVVDPVGSKLAYVGQLLNSPAVAVLGHFTAAGGYPVYGRPAEVGQIYTAIAGMLNLLCIVNAVYMAHVRQVQPIRRMR